MSLLASSIPSPAPAVRQPLRLVMHGAAGRMGGRIVACAAAEPGQWKLVGAIDRAGHPRIGADAGLLAGVTTAGVAISDGWSCPADVVIDFSLPGAVAAIARICSAKKVPLVVATTGLEASDQEAVTAASKTIAVLQSPSMSLAVNVAMDLVSRAATLLHRTGSRADVEIIECHHRHKEDSPSGTALKFGSLVQAAMGQTAAAHGRAGRPGARPADEIGYHAVRAGDNPGEHTILFGLEGESLSVSVRATNRDCYARGALAAAAFLADKPAGMYSMRDVLGIS
ncbi:MAG: 4-hydroxy-tetrahydrodipicolinate reductase [Planctomycetota bacterium]|nr:MAG: 4-hydroxy-tetrahydrodipicolinate reductase [Planctomycetota bacterium]